MSLDEQRIGLADRASRPNDTDLVHWQQMQIMDCAPLALTVTEILRWGFLV